MHWRVIGKYDPATVNAMFELLRTGLCMNKPNPVATNMDWSALMKLSSEQGVLSWVWEGVCQLPIEERPNRFQKISWELSVQSVVDRYNRQKQVLAELVEVCGRNDMRLMLLKGIGLSKLYPKPEHRPSGDIDIFLFDDFEKGNAVFALNTDTDTGLHTEFFYKGVHIENHELFIYPNTPTKKRVCQYLNSRIPNVVLSSDGYYTFAPQDNLVYLMMHALNHVNFNANTAFLNIRNLTDIAVVINHYRTTWKADELFRLMDQLMLGQSFELVVYFSEWLLNTDFPEFHRNLIRPKDLDIIKDLFITQCLTVPIPRQDGVVGQFAFSLVRYFRFRKIYKYMPRHKNSFFFSCIHQFIQLKRPK